MKIRLSPVTGSWLYDLVYVIIMMGIGVLIGIALHLCQ